LTVIVDCWLLTVEGGVEKLNGWVLTVDSILLLWCNRKRYYEEFEALQALIADREDVMDFRVTKEEDANQPSVPLAEAKRMLEL
jgi:hypothetical protein